ncbi:MAG TPA: FIST N-terminal domain-containing protein [Solirubrobacteraceae bacterium]|jgi:small ligand-binding sensory domain FIST|nr:FIST N-terminal domain-containing protein [Solirubrobacteraceae bacterium]
MSVRIGTGLSTASDAREAAIEAGVAARDALGGDRCDLAIVFASGLHLGVPETLLEAVHEALVPEQLVGCGAGGVIGPHREIEEGTAVSIWAAHLGDGSAVAFHAAVEELEEGAGALTGMPDLDGAAGAILLADPATFPTDAVLRFLSDATPMISLLGGLASGRTGDGAVLFMGEEVLDEGAVGVRLDGVEMLPCVSQGATPIGPELTITAADGNVIEELAGRPALMTLRETIESLPSEELEMVEGGLLVGIVVDSNKPEYVQGDFLVRGLVGADPASGKVAVAADVHPGQVVRLHARDAFSADRDLREALAVQMTALGGRAPAGALLFACNGRGRDMFSHPHHDADALAEALLDAPAAGFFAAGEIGPVGGEHFLHSFTATIAVFP